MSITSQELAAIARSLARGENEVAWRSSASRCYYAAYHSALDHAGCCPPHDKGQTGVHAQLARRYELLGTRDAKSIAQALALMKRQRAIADYALDYHFTKEAAEDQLAKFDALSRRIVSFSIQQISQNSSTAK